MLNLRKLTMRARDPIPRDKKCLSRSVGMAVDSHLRTRTLNMRKQIERSRPVERKVTSPHLHNIPYTGEIDVFPSAQPRPCRIQETIQCWDVVGVQVAFVHGQGAVKHLPLHSHGTFS